MYKDLAKYYDVLVKDDQATQLWVDFFNRHQSDKTVLELASGTGEITLELAKNYLVDASDISEPMLNEIKAKDNNMLNDIFKLDMTNFNLNKTYDNIICFCDSINYILDLSDLESMFKSVASHLKVGGSFMFDMHTKDRLKEFSDPYIEVGQVLDTDFQWTIQTEDDFILHHFAFYTEAKTKQSHHIQKVFDLNIVVKLLEDLDFDLKIYTDFDQSGIHPGEKIFIVGRKL